MDIKPIDSHDIKLAACPFCGSIHIHHESQSGIKYARCQDCSSSGGYVFDFEMDKGILYTRETVCKRWNMRMDV